MGEKRKKIVLLDMMAILHRGYHALPSFTTKSGTPTGAIYGLCLMLLSLYEKFKPDEIYACFDLPDETFRSELFKDYKGKRGETDDDLIVQFDIARELLKNFSIPTHEYKGYEADDIIGTLSVNLRKEQNQIIIASGDMDTMQLVAKDEVVVYTLKKGIKDTILYDEKAVIDRFGFEPKYLTDYKGLRGDPSDNIPGVRGVGEKTASILISKYKTLENLYKKIEKNKEAFKVEAGVTERIVNLLIEQKDEAMFSKQLATIVLDVPIKINESPVSWQGRLKKDQINVFLKKYEFNSLISRWAQVLGWENNSIQIIKEKEIPKLTYEETEKRKITKWILDPERGFTDEELSDLDISDLEKKIELESLSYVYKEIELPLIPIIKEMSRKGIKVDKSRLSFLKKKFDVEIQKLEAKIFEIAGEEFNIRSTQQLSDILFKKLKLSTEKISKTKSGHYSTNVKTLDKLSGQHIIISLIEEHREISKLLNTYVETLPELINTDGRIHATFLQYGTATGRFSSQDPNLQNIPTKSGYGELIREAFVPEKGYEFIAFDYSQMELRLAAILSNDKTLIHIFNENRDVHEEVAARVFNVTTENVTADMRRAAKTINFGIMYGMGARALSFQLNTSQKEAKEYLENYKTAFISLMRYFDDVKAFARENGFVDTAFGRKRFLHEIGSHSPLVQTHAERAAMNHPIQGTGADIIKISMAKVDQYLKANKIKNIELVVQVHDELIYESEIGIDENVLQELKKIMEEVLYEFAKIDLPKIPIIVNIKKGLSWAGLK